VLVPEINEGGGCPFTGSPLREEDEVESMGYEEGGSVPELSA
jgi:hypothetical protein